MATNPTSVTCEPPALLEHLGAQVRGLRNRRGMSRKSLARHSSVSERYLADLEQGRGNVSITLLDRIARALQIELGQLLKAQEDQTPEQDLMLELIRDLSPENQRVALQMLYERFSVPAAGSRRIALIGLRGAGKTTLGELLAKRLDVPFVGLVGVIEGLAGMSVSEIFSLSGEAGYRRLEEEALLETLKRNKSCVIETGGSIVAEPSLLNILLTTCFVVWLRTSPEQYMARVVAQGDLRPMLNHPDAMANLRRLLEEREPFYSKAHAIIDTSDQAIDDSLADIAGALPAELRSSEHLPDSGSSARIKVC